MLLSLRKLTWLQSSSVVFMKLYFVTFSLHVTSKLQQENNDGQHYSKSDCLFYSLSSFLESSLQQGFTAIWRYASVLSGCGPVVRYKTPFSSLKACKSLKINLLLVHPSLFSKPLGTTASQAVQGRKVKLKYSEGKAGRQRLMIQDWN